MPARKREVHLGGDTWLQKGGVHLFSGTLIPSFTVRIRPPATGGHDVLTRGLQPRHRRSTTDTQTVRAIKRPIAPDRRHQRAKPRAHVRHGQNQAGPRVTKERSRRCCGLRHRIGNVADVPQGKTRRQQSTGNWQVNWQLAETLSSTASFAIDDPNRAPNQLAATPNETDVRPTRVATRVERAAARHELAHTGESHQSNLQDSSIDGIRRRGRRLRPRGNDPSHGVTLKKCGCRNIRFYCSPPRVTPLTSRDFV